MKARSDASSLAAQFLPEPEATPGADAVGAGILAVASEALKLPQSIPFLLVRPATFKAYSAELKWLAQVGAIRAGVYQRG